MSLPLDSTIVSAIIGLLAGLLPSVYKAITSKSELRASNLLGMIDKLIAEGDTLRQELKNSIEQLQVDIENLKKENKELEEANWSLKDKVHQLTLRIRELENDLGKKKDE